MIDLSRDTALGLALSCACLPVFAVFSAPPVNAQAVSALKSLEQSPHSPIPSQRYFSDIEEPEALPVRQRPRPDYNAGGLRYSSFLFFPNLMTTPFYDSNVYATSGNKQSDAGIIFASALVANSDWNNHELMFDVGMVHVQYFDLQSETQTDGHAAVSGRVDVRRDLVVMAAVSAARHHEQRGTSNSPMTAAEPVPYDEFDGSLSVTKSFNRVDVSLGAAAEHRNYHSVRSVSGGSLNQDYRDGNWFNVGGRVSYLMKPGIQIFGDLRYNWRRYDNASGLNSNSQGYNLFGGLEFTLTSLIRGEIGIGYMSQSYDGAGISDPSGLKYSANLIWNATPLITVTLKGERLINEAGIVGAGGRIDSDVSIALDYELRRNVIVSPSVSILYEDYVGIPRSDFVAEPNLKVDYLINRNFSVGAEYAYTIRDSSMSVNDFNRHYVGINAQAQF